jgi:hypothetical protein
MNKSESIAQLALALSKLQSEVQDVYKDRQGYGYKYADLASVLDVTRPLCAKYELAVTQLCGTDSNGSPTVETVILHSSGEWISGTLSIPMHAAKGLSPAQCMGICISYGRRYALAAALGVAQTDNDASIHPEKDEEQIADPATLAATNPQDKLTDKLKSKLGAPNELPVQRLRQLIAAHKLEDKELGWLEHFSVASLEDLGAGDVLKLIKTIEGKV